MRAARFQERMLERTVRMCLRDLKRSRVAAISRISRGNARLAAAKIGEGGGIGPTGRPHRLPEVEIQGVAPEIAQRIHRRAAAQRPPDRDGFLAPRQAGLRKRREALGVALARHGDEGGGRHADRGTMPGRPGLDQQHSGVGVLRQARCHHGAGRAAAHDDVVVLVAFARGVQHRFCPAALAG